MQTNFSINSIAMGNIRGRRRQYLLLITAIVLAVYFTSTALLFASAMSTSLRERHYHRMGEQDAILLNCQDAPLEELLDKGVFSRYGTAEILGYVLPDGQNQANGFSIAKFDDIALDLAHNDPLEGRLPEKAGEIALEQSALARMRTDAGVGDTLTLTLMVPDGSGFMDSPVQNSYTLVGILNDKQLNLKQWAPNFPVYNDFPAGVLSAEEQIPPGGRAVINCYGRYASRDTGASYEQLKLFCEEYGLLNDYGLANIAGTSYQFSDRYYDKASNSIVTTSVFFMVIAAVLVLAACLGIVNAFSASLESRKRQIGLLRAVGATKRQIRHIFGRETFLLSIFSIPLSLLLSCLTVWGITAAMGAHFTFRPDPLLIAAAAAAGVLCVIPAAWIPLRRATRIPPMQAIREVELSRKIRKSSLQSRQFFDVPRLIAHRSLTLYKNKQISITAMLAVSIVLMSLVILVAAPVLREAAWDYGADYLLRKTSRHMDWLMEYSINQPGITQQDKNDAAALSTVKTVKGEKYLRLKILTDRVTPYITGSNRYGFTYLSPELQANIIIDIPEDSQWDAQLHQAQQHMDYLESKAKYGYAQDYLTVDCCGVEAEVLEKLSPFVSSGRINIDRLSSGEEVLIVAPEEYGLYEETYGSDTWVNTDYALDNDRTYISIYENDLFQAGDTITISLLYSDEPAQHPDGPVQFNEDGSRKLPENVVRIDRTVTIGAILEPRAGERHLLSYFNTYIHEVGSILTTTEGLKTLGFDVPYDSLAITLSESPDAATEEYLEVNLGQIAARTSGVDLSSYVAMARENREMVFGLLMAAGAVLLLFFAICVSMINNALSARIRASRREIGTIRAVGASQREIVRSYLWQLISMFAWGTTIGMAVQLALCGWMLTVEHMNLSGAVPSWQPLLFVVALFGICFLNLRSKVSGIFKDSIVENIREL